MPSRPRVDGDVSSSRPSLGISGFKWHNAGINGGCPKL